MPNQRPETDTSVPELWNTRSEGYGKLGWKENADLLGELVRFADVQPNQTYLDAGTGDAEVAEKFIPVAQAVTAFDFSAGMLRKADERLNGSRQQVALFQGDITRIPLPDNSFDFVGARMVLHHIHEPERAIAEMARVSSENGGILIAEYVAPTAAYNHERAVFDIKEADRHLWTEKTLWDLVRNSIPRQKSHYWSLKSDISVLPAYSVKNWLAGNNQLTQEQKDEIFQLYVDAPGEVQAAMNIAYQMNPDGEVVDALVDRPFCYIKATKICPTR